MAGKWPEDHDELLTKLWGEGLSASRVASELNFTFGAGAGYSRNAVIGRIHRLRVTRDSRIHRLRVTTDTKAKEATPRRTRTTPWRPPERPNPSFAAPPFALPPDDPPSTAREPTAIDLLDHHDWMCRAVLGNNPVMYCSTPASNGPYCDAHRPPSRREAGAKAPPPPNRPRPQEEF